MLCKVISCFSNPCKCKPFQKNPPISRAFREIGYADELGAGMRNIGDVAELQIGPIETDKEINKETNKETNKEMISTDKEMINTDKEAVKIFRRNHKFIKNWQGKIFMRIS